MCNIFLISLHFTAEKANPLTGMRMIHSTVNIEGVGILSSLPTEERTDGVRRTHIFLESSRHIGSNDITLQGWLCLNLFQVLSDLSRFQTSELYFHSLSLSRTAARFKV